MFYTYVLRNPKSKLYKGSTDNLRKRIRQHNSRKFRNYTKNLEPWELIYKESFATRQEAEAREKFFKSGRGREFLKKILKN